MDEEELEVDTAAVEPVSTTSATSSKRGHSVKVPRLYKEAGRALERVEGGEGFKNVVYTLKHPNVKALTALVSEAIKHGRELDLLLDKSKLAQKEPALAKQIPLARILMTELLWGKGRLGGSSKPVSTILGYHDKFQKILRKEERKTGGTTLTQQGNDEESTVQGRQKPRYIRVNTLKISLEAVISHLKDEGWICIEEFDENWSPDDLKAQEFCVDDFVENLLIFSTSAAPQFFNHPLYLDGSLVLQDKASCLPPLALKPRRGREILDACAAPGMKTSLLAALTNNESPIIAVERDPKRFQTLQNLLGGLGATSVRFINTDFSDLNPEDYPDTEYILLDPSCSGSGMVGRVEQENSNQYLRTQKLPNSSRYKEETRKSLDKWTEMKGRLRKLAFYQMKLLLHAMKFPKVKRIVYSTCSVNSEENEDVVGAALEESPIKFRVKRCLPNWTNRVSHPQNSLAQFQKQYEWIDSCVKSSFEENRTDGFFVAILERA